MIEASSLNGAIRTVEEYDESSSCAEAGARLLIFWWYQSGPWRQVCGGKERVGETGDDPILSEHGR